ncbi:MAG: helix-turn-helix domain-containing protein [Oscillospiraceae bacterium]|nr:helix-turn-helix domain-containing protein [Oscillospiraceae bacterium]
MFYERLKAACVEKGTTPSAMAKSHGITTANTGPWKHGKTPSVDILVKFATSLEVSTDYLLGLTDSPSRSVVSDASLTEEEARIIELYRSTAPEVKGAVKTMLETYDWVMKKAAEINGDKKESPS